MTAFALIVGWLLTSQVNAGDNRYPFQSPGQAGTAAAQGSATAQGDAGGAKTSPFTGGTGSKADGFSRGDTTPIGSAGGLNRGSAETATPPRTLPLVEGESRPITDANSSRSAPAGYDVSPAQSLGAAAQPNTGLTPSAMMRAMLTAQSSSQLRGQPVTLVEVIAGARTRAEQTQRAEAYWDLCSSVADYYLGLREQDELQRYVQRGGSYNQFEVEMRNRTSTAQRAAVASQLRLASLMGRGSDYLPLPSDVPHCASYHTHYQQIFPNGGPQEAKELNDLLPLRYKELKVAAASVTGAESYLSSFATSRSNDIEGGLNALHLLALQRRAFVQIARDYNRRIARYAELASPGPLTPERLTGMLIKSPMSTATKSASPAPSLNRQTNRKAPPSTFVDGASPPKRDDAVQAASGEEPSSVGGSSPRRERSLMVKPPK